MNFLSRLDEIPDLFSSVGFWTITAWIVLTAVGAVVSIFNLRDAWIDMKILQDRRLVNGRTLIAKVGLANEASRFVAHCLLLAAGILVAAVQFNANPPPASLYVRSAILMTIIILVTNTIVERWVRHKLTRPR